VLHGPPSSVGAASVRVRLDSAGDLWAQSRIHVAPTELRRAFRLIYYTHGASYRSLGSGPPKARVHRLVNAVAFVVVPSCMADSFNRNPLLTKRYRKSNSLSRERRRSRERPSEQLESGREKPENKNKTLTLTKVTESLHLQCVGIFAAPWTDLQSQRDCASKPRVARNELPWMDLHRDPNPNGRWGCASAPLNIPPHLGPEGKTPFGIFRQPSTAL